MTVVIVGEVDANYLIDSIEWGLWLEKVKVKHYLHLFYRQIQRADLFLFTILKNMAFSAILINTAFLKLLDFVIFYRCCEITLL